jgi:hypothetical protein
MDYIFAYARCNFPSDLLSLIARET